MFFHARYLNSIKPYLPTILESEFCWKDKQYFCRLFLVSYRFYLSKNIAGRLKRAIQFKKWQYSVDFFQGWINIVLEM